MLSLTSPRHISTLPTRAVDTANGRVVPKRPTNLKLRGEDIFNFRSENGNLTCDITNIRMTSGEESKSRNGLFKRRADRAGPAREFALTTTG
jgi:hypothetical protein